jgi:hypothetical protein
LLIDVRYWDWSLDAEPQNEASTRVFDSEIFQADTGFGGNGHRVVATPEQNRLNITGSTGGGCVMNGPFALPNFNLNVPTPHCLTRDFVPWILNRMADSKLVEEVLAQPDYTSVARAIEKTKSFSPSNIHASGHFGIGGILGTMGNAAESPGGESQPSYLFHAPFQTSYVWLLAYADIFQIPFSTYIMVIWTAYSGNGNKRTLRRVSTRLEDQ